MINKFVKGKTVNKEMKKRIIVYVFIDASNLWEVQKAKGRFFDYEKLIKLIK